MEELTKDKNIHVQERENILQKYIFIKQTISLKLNIRFF
jgi:hypothetical protein